MKYNEKKILQELEQYIETTYSQHYVSGGEFDDFQIQDLFDHLGIAESFCRGSALKYLVRFGKKNGKSKEDIFKAMHYLILMYYYAFEKESKKRT